MRKFKARIECAVKCLFYEDVVFLGFRKKLTKGTIITATDKKEIDTLAEQIMELLSEVAKIQ